MMWALYIFFALIALAVGTASGMYVYQTILGWGWLD